MPIKTLKVFEVTVMLDSYRSSVELLAYTEDQALQDARKLLAIALNHNVGKEVHQHIVAALQENTAGVCISKVDILHVTQIVDDESSSAETL